MAVGLVDSNWFDAHAVYCWHTRSVVDVGSNNSNSELEHVVRVVHVLSAEADAGADWYSKPRHIARGWHWRSVDIVAAPLSYCAAVHAVIALHCPGANWY